MSSLSKRRKAYDRSLRTLLYLCAGITCALTSSETDWSGLDTMMSMYGDSGDRFVEIMPLISSMDCWPCLSHWQARRCRMRACTPR